MHSIFTPLRLVYLCFSVAVAAGCSSSDDAAAAGSSIPGPVAVSANYDLRADVKKLDAAAWDPMVVAHEGPGLWVKRDARDTDWLKPGAVTVIKGRGVLKVGAVTEEGDHLVVENLPSDYGEFIENGTIEIAGATSFDLPVVDEPGELDVKSNGEPPVQNNPTTQSRPLSVAPLGIGKILSDNVNKTLKDDWQVEKKITGDGDALHYDITLTRNAGGMLARLHAVGSVNNLKTALKVAVQNRVTQQNVFDVHTSGNADLTWEVGISEGSVSYDKIVLPGITYRQQFLVGEVPMVMKVKTGMAIIVGATGKNSTTTGRVHVDYTSDGGVQVESGSGGSNASGSGDTSYADDRGTLTIGPSAFGFVATLPRVEIGVGVDGLFVAGPFFSNTSTTIVKSRGAIGGNACADIDMKFEGNMGLFVEAGIATNLLTKGIEKTGTKLSKKIYEVNKKAASCGLK